MGVLTDYFRAPGVAAVQEQMAERDGGPLVSEHSESAFDGVELKDVDPAVALGRLVAFAMDTAYGSDLLNDRLVWPEGGEQDAEYMGPWVVVLDDQTRDALPGIPASRILDLAQRWADIEKFGGLVTVDDLSTAVEQLTALAVRARESGESLYCWICL